MMSEEEEEDILFDRSGPLEGDEEEQLLSDDNSAINDSPVPDSPIHVRANANSSPIRGRIFQTFCLCAAFFGLGLCIAIPGPTLLDLQEQTNTDTEQISRLFTGRSFGYLFGSFFGGFLFDRVNQTCLLWLSLLLTAIGTAAAPWCRNILLLIGIVSFQGISMGFLDTGGNVLCLYIWGRNSGPYMQAMHFVFGLGAFVAPLLAEPFLSHGNTTNMTVFENISVDFEPITVPIVHSRHLLAIAESLNPNPVNISTVAPKAVRPDSDGKFLNPDHADGHIVGKIIQENEKNQKNLPEVKPVIAELPGLNETLNNTVIDTGQSANIPSTTVTTTVKASSTPNINLFTYAWDSDNSTLDENSTDPTALDKIRHKFIQVAHTVTEAFNSFSKVQFAYLVIAVFILLVSFMFLFHCCCCGRCTCKAIKHQQDNFKMKKESTGFRVQILMLLFVFYFLYVGMEVTYGGLVMSFAVNYLKWSKSSGTLVTSVFWGSFAAGRLLAIPLSKCLSPAIMIVADLVLTIFSLAGLVIFVSDNHILMWICTTTLGVGLASIFPTGITWAERYMQVTGKTTAVFVVGSALGEMLLPLLTGFLFQNKGPMFLMYIMLACAFVSMIVYIIMQNLATNMGERYQAVPRHKRRRNINKSTVIPLHSIDSEDEDDLNEDDSVPLMAGTEDVQRRKKVRFNLRNGSVRDHGPQVHIANGNSKPSILKSRKNMNGKIQ